MAYVNWTANDISDTLNRALLQHGVRLLAARISAAWSFPTTDLLFSSTDDTSGGACAATIPSSRSNAMDMAVLCNSDRHRHDRIGPGPGEQRTPVPRTRSVVHRAVHVFRQLGAPAR